MNAISDFRDDGDGCIIDIELFFSQDCWFDASLLILCVPNQIAGVAYLETDQSQLKKTIYSKKRYVIIWMTFRKKRLQSSAKQLTIFMGNLTNEENWAARERLRMIEVLLWWRGWVRRGDLIDVFGISAAQASGDIQRFLELNRAGVIYHTNRKRYEAGESFTCRLHRPSLAEAVTLLMGQRAGNAALTMRAETVPTQASDLVDIVTMPQRVANERAVRTLVMAMLRKETVEVRYASVNSSTRKLRTLVPRAIAWDGTRWHARCWDPEHSEWRDYVLGRMEECRWAKFDADEPPADIDWETFVILKLKPNSSLSKDAKAAIKMDYGMSADVIEIRVRKAMVKYVRQNLGLPWENGSQATWEPYFQVVSEKKEA